MQNLNEMGVREKINNLKPAPWFEWLLDTGEGHYLIKCPLCGLCDKACASCDFCGTCENGELDEK